jgi:membrane fusion protein (multidrug efflux system)
MALILMTAACNEAQTAPAGPPQGPIPVGVVTSERRDLSLYLDVVGSLDGYVNVEVRARVRGYLTRQTYKDGARVKSGEVMFRIEPAEHAASGAAAAANLTRARVALERAGVEAERSRGLRQAGVISRQDLDNAEAAVREADALVHAGRADAARASLDLRYTTLRSPVDGIAGIAQVRAGNLVGQDGPTLLTTVSQLDPMRVDFRISEVEYVKHPEWAAHPEAAGELQLVLADGSTYVQSAVLVAIDRGVDRTTGTVQLQALVPNPDGRLRPGEYARVRIPDASGKGVVVVPERALVAVQGTFSIAVVGADQKVSFKRVELGPSKDGMRVVRAGLAEGEQIVIEGLPHIIEGAAVEPHPANLQAKG